MIIPLSSQQFGELLTSVDWNNPFRSLSRPMHLIMRLRACLGVGSTYDRKILKRSLSRMVEDNMESCLDLYALLYCMVALTMIVAVLLELHHEHSLSRLISVGQFHFSSSVTGIRASLFYLQITFSVPAEGDLTSCLGDSEWKCLSSRGKANWSWNWVRVLWGSKWKFFLTPENMVVHFDGFVLIHV